MKNYFKKYSYLKGLIKIENNLKYDLHHCIINNSKLNRKKYPLFIDSILNLRLIEHNYHIANNNKLIYDLRKKLDFKESDLDYLEYLIRNDDKIGSYFLMKNNTFEEYFNNGIYINELLKNDVILNKYCEEVFDKKGFEKKNFIKKEFSRKHDIIFTNNYNLDVYNCVDEKDKIICNNYVTKGEHIKFGGADNVLKKFSNETIWIIDPISSLSYLELHQNQVYVDIKQFKRNLIKTHDIIRMYGGKNKFNVLLFFFGEESMNKICDIFLKIKPIIHYNKRLI